MARDPAQSQFCHSMKVYRIIKSERRKKWHSSTLAKDVAKTYGSVAVTQQRPTVHVAVD